jgi:hypothetical protein
MKRINFYSTYDKSKGGVVLDWWVHPVIILIIIIFGLTVLVCKGHTSVDKTVPMPEINIERECAFIKQILMIDMLIQKILERNPELNVEGRPKK